MITTTKLFIVLATLGLLMTTTTSFAIGNVFGQTVTPPPLESTPANGSEKEDTPISLGKATIPVSSGEQIIIDIPFKDGNTYKLVPIK